MDVEGNKVIVAFRGIPNLQTNRMIIRVNNGYYIL